MLINVCKQKYHLKQYLCLVLKSDVKKSEIYNFITWISFILQSHCQLGCFISIKDLEHLSAQIIKSLLPMFLHPPQKILMKGSCAVDTTFALCCFQYEEWVERSKIKATEISRINLQDILSF